MQLVARVHLLIVVVMCGVSADGVVWYAMAQGERRGVDVDLTDATYDGIVDGQRLSGGLGQLTDGELGQANFRAVDRRASSIKATTRPGVIGRSIPRHRLYPGILWLRPV